LLALPVASVVMVVLRYVHERYTASELYRASDEPEIVIVGADGETVVTSDDTSLIGTVVAAERVTPPGSS
jgi:hypothetical protein